jgi:hypothetical protein
VLAVRVSRVGASEQPVEIMSEPTGETRASNQGSWAAS